MLDIALRRKNTRMTLVVPRTPNVYQDANRKAIKRLFETNRARRGGDSSNLEVYLLEDMLHAKVLYAESVDTEVPDVSMLGSCNLKQRPRAVRRTQRVHPAAGAHDGVEKAIARSRERFAGAHGA